MSTAFDAFAENYDAEFSHTRLGLMLRARVWRVLAQYIAPPQRVLELACGTGEDAMWLARRGCAVIATDASPKMLAVTQAKAQSAGLAQHVDTRILSWQTLINSPPDSWPIHGPFDGLFSNFGGLNTTNQWAKLAQSLAQLLTPGGFAILVPMGPVCPWEIGWHLLHGQPQPALRRFRPFAPAQIGDTTIPIYYPPLDTLKDAFSPWFQHQHSESLGLWLPPSYLGHLLERFPARFAHLSRLEQKTATLLPNWGDHYIVCFRRRG